jgi:hypothetical protein
MLVPILVLFLWSESYNLSKVIDHNKFGTFGDFFGGVIGSIWSLGGMLLFYYALIEQRKDFGTNREALFKQIEALNLQAEEFKLQREELSESRKVFSEQAKTIKQQRLESIYFSLIDLYNKIIISLDNHTESKNFFKEFRNSLEGDILTNPNSITAYQLNFNNKKEDLAHYFKTVYRILRIIDESDMNREEKFKYIKILRSQLSENEMFALYYNSRIPEGGRFYELILKYNLLKHLPRISKLEFVKYKKYIEDNKVRLIHLSDFMEKFLVDFLVELNHKIYEDNFNNLTKSKKVFEESNFILGLKSSETHELEIQFRFKQNSYKLCRDEYISEFREYIKLLLEDIFVLSRYNKIDWLKIKIHNSTNEADNEVIFLLESKQKLVINSDKGL